MDPLKCRPQCRWSCQWPARLTDRFTLITSLREKEAGGRSHYLGRTDIVEWNVEPKAVRAEYWHGLETIQEYEMNILVNLSQNVKAAGHLK